MLLNRLRVNNFARVKLNRPQFLWNEVYVWKFSHLLKVAGKKSVHGLAESIKPTVSLLHYVRLILFRYLYSFDLTSFKL